MLSMKRVGLTGAAAVLSLLSVSLGAPTANAATYSDQSASIVVWPKIAAQTDVEDTQITLSSTNPSGPVAAHCVYVNANSHCNNTGDVCTTSSSCFDSSTGLLGSCVPGWVEFDFDVVLTANQPLAWSALEGLGGAGSGSDRSLANGHLPCPGLPFRADCPMAIGSNAGTRVPPVSESPFVGELKCIQSDPITRRPAVCGGANEPCQDYLVGTATIQRLEDGHLSAAEYNGVGLKSAGANDGDGFLNIGGDDAEYEPCAEVLIFNHLFDGATDPISDEAGATTELTLVPCSEDFLTQTMPPVTAQFLVYNEFEQRFSTSRPVPCLLDSQISLIDTSQPDRSIFSAGVAGTVSGQTRIRGVGGGLLGAAVLNLEDLARGSSAYNLDGFAERSAGDLIRIP
jgi:hypothetical protein